jgi:hypothetical protein
MKSTNKYWWQYLLAIPPSKNHYGFKRIYRLIRDTTRVRKYKAGRLNEFYHSGHETHLTATLWENFAIARDYSWIKDLTSFTEKELKEQVMKCNWSYELERQHDGKNKLLDVVISFQT